MARIVYSCCGEGRGHSSRTLTLARRLIGLGHEVHVLASNAAYAALSPLLPNVTEIPGLVLVYGQNRVRVRRTLGANLSTWRRKKEIVQSIEALMKSIRPSLAITDFEPFLPIAARRLGIPFVAVDHQHVIPGLDLPVPAKYWGYHAATLAIVHLTHRGELANLVTSFFRPEKPFRPEYHYFGPILREEASRLTPKTGEHVLVYQTSASFENLPDLLSGLPFEFRIYAYQREGRVGNCVFKPRNHPDFLADLASCSWVLTNGGYTLISEALHLGKPVFAIPVSGQFEQWINAWHLEKLGYGMRCERNEFTPGKITEFAGSLKRFRKSMNGTRFDGTEEILGKVRTYL